MIRRSRSSRSRGSPRTSPARRAHVRVAVARSNTRTAIPPSGSRSRTGRVVESGTRALGELAKRHIAVDARFGRKSERALRDHRAMDLIGAAADDRPEAVDEEGLP